MHESIQTIMTLFGLMPDTTTMTVGDYNVNYNTEGKLEATKTKESGSN